MENINQLKINREFFLGFARNPQVTTTTEVTLRRANILSSTHWSITCITHSLRNKSLLILVIKANRINKSICGDKEFRKKTERQMGIEPMTFRSLVGCSTTEPRELTWLPRSLNWVMIHGLCDTITWMIFIYLLIAFITNISRDLFQSDCMIQLSDQCVLDTYALAFKWLCDTNMLFFLISEIQYNHILPQNAPFYHVNTFYNILADLSRFFWWRHSLGT